MQQNKNGAMDMSNFAPESSEPTLAQPIVNKKKKANWPVAILVVIIIAAAVLFYLDASGKVNLFGGKQANPTINFDSGNWKAVFLTNGQVYFGHLENKDSAYPVLKDIYYLQVQKAPIQPAQAATNEQGVNAAETQDQLILVKFGTELHKPLDEMVINKDHIMFFEDLSADSPVVKSIEDYLNAEATKAAEPAK
jgi:hypothetical protein